MADITFDTALGSDGVPKSAQEALRDGAVQLSCFLDSSGGSAECVHNFRLTCAEILSRNGVVSTHGFEMIVSAAADIWAIADAEHRFVLDETQALWHTGEERESTGISEMSGPKKEHEELRTIRIEREKREILMVFKGVPADEFEDIRRRVLDPKNLRGEVRFTGIQLAQMGLARSFPTREEGLAHFLSSSGLSDCGIQDSNSFKDLLATPRVNSLSGALQGILKKK